MNLQLKERNAQIIAGGTHHVPEASGGIGVHFTPWTLESHFIALRVPLGMGIESDIKNLERVEYNAHLS